MPEMNVAAYAGPIWVSLAYVLLYYVFQVRVLAVKLRLEREYSARGEKLDRYFGQDRELLAADRVQLNTLEHMGPFLVLLWLNAVFVGPFGAAVAGTVYVTARAMYPLAMGAKLGRGIRPLIMASTAPGYGVLAYFAGALIYRLVG